MVIVFFQKLGESEMQISLAKPPTENKQKEKRRQQYKQIQFTRGFVQIL